MESTLATNGMFSVGQSGVYIYICRYNYGEYVAIYNYGEERAHARAREREIKIILHLLDEHFSTFL